MVIAKKKKKIPTLAPEELEKRLHRKEIREIFRVCGFNRVSGITGKDFVFKGRTGEFDDVFLFENIVVLIEYTTAKSSNASGHLTGKKIIFDRVLENRVDFIDFFENEFETFRSARDQ